MRPSTRVLIALLIGVAVLLIFTVGVRETPNISFVVPDQYRGLFSISERKRGVEPKRDGKNWIYEIPESGQLIVNDASVFENWHTKGAVYKNGTILPVPTQAQPGDVMLSTLEVRGDGTWYFFVGTPEEGVKARSTSNRPLSPE
jgi:hypothetical protein